MKEPKIRFKGFQGEWEEHSLSEKEFSIIAGGDIDRTIFQKSGNYPVVANAITCDGILGYYENSYRVKGPAVTVTGRGEVGVAFARHYSFTPVVRLLAITSSHNVDVLANAINLCKVPIESTGVPQLTTSKLQEYNVFMPQTLDEEDKLASYFQHLDSLIQSTTKKIESLKQVKAASLQSMFPQEGETTPRVRFKGFEGEWEKVLIGKMGVTYSGLSGKTKDDFGFGEARFITFLNVLTNAKIDTSILEPVNVNRDEHQNEVRKGDLLFNTSSETPEEVGMCAVMDERLENVYLNSFCFGFRVTDNNIDPTCVAYMMRSHIGRRIMSILAQGATRYNLSKNSFCKAVLVLPKNIAEQHAIASYFTNLDRQITLQSQRLEKLKQIKSACLDNMFV